jgi:hypothetical protein
VPGQPIGHLFKGKESKKSCIITSFSYYLYQEEERKKRLTQWSSLSLSHPEMEMFPAFRILFYSSAFPVYLMSLLFYKGEDNRISVNKKGWECIVFVRVTM